MVRYRVRLSYLALAWLSLNVGALASASRPTLQDRLERVSSAREAPLAAGAATQAREALARSRSRDEAGDRSGAARARTIADAALTLAERQVARARAAEALRITRLEAVEAAHRLEVARAAVRAETAGETPETAGAPDETAEETPETAGAPDEARGDAEPGAE